MAEAMWPAKPEVFIVWHFTEKCAKPWLHVKPAKSLVLYNGVL